jgi:hypothetical protein
LKTYNWRLSANAKLKSYPSVLSSLEDLDGPSHAHPGVGVAGSGAAELCGLLVPEKSVLVLLGG